MLQGKGIKAVILAGGRGTRISEETAVKPKPLISVGHHPILWHIMKIYSHYGIDDFVICLGYKGYLIKEYFNNYALHNATSVTFDMKKGMQMHESRTEDWRVTLVETGEDTMTGGRLKRILPYVSEDTLFCMTYGDGVGNIDIGEAIRFHKSHGKLATVTAVKPMARFGSLDIKEGAVKSFIEKPLGEGGYINGGFFVLSPKALRYVDGDETFWEKEPLERLTKDGQLMAFQHEDFWQPMDTLRDHQLLENLWVDGKAPWKIWNESPAKPLQSNY